MREIKFRAWNIEEEIMCYDNEDDSACYWDGVVASNVGLINSRLKRYEGYKETYEYMQYTGLKNRNGVEIFEGDIVQASDFREKYMVIVYDQNQCKFKACPVSAYVINAGNGGYTGYGISEHYTVEGNVYENPEFLNQ